MLKNLIYGATPTWLSFVLIVLVQYFAIRAFV